ncbi:hypothetical protein M0802_001315 [Mischocyttarus mexicanus]|nr:hypothetical protein M0802_001315 [Mischocyttarus mexicanus]
MSRHCDRVLEEKGKKREKGSSSSNSSSSSSSTSWLCSLVREKKRVDGMAGADAVAYGEQKRKERWPRVPRHCLPRTPL